MDSIQFRNLCYHFQYFFLKIRLLFLIFHIEITFFPIILYLKYINFYSVLNIISLSIFIILFTLIIERIIGFIYIEYFNSTQL